MSEHSPRPVAATEKVTRFVLHQRFVDKRGELKPNFWSHVFTQGCSAQRDAVASDDEIFEWLSASLTKQMDWSWHGVVSATCSDIRNLVTSEARRAICVYDTSEPTNTSHAEMFATRHAIPETDRAVWSRQLTQVFGGGLITARTVYREGRVWSALSNDLRTRPVKVTSPASAP